jgi:signal transduction histidine kinase
MTRIYPLKQTKCHLSKFIFDFAAVLITFVIMFSLSSFFNFSDQFIIWASKYEHSLDIDELPLALLACLIVLLWFLQQRNYELTQLMKQNHGLLKRILAVQEEERKRLALDLHDDLGQYLNAIKVQATSLFTTPSTHEEFTKTAFLIVSTADHAYQAARQMIHTLRPVALDELGLAAALEHLVNTWRQNNQYTQTPTEYSLYIKGEIDHLNEPMNIAIFRIVQEALTNIAKYAQANQANINIIKTSEKITLDITDDGLGFDPNNKQKGYGLLGMQERAEAFNGEMKIASALHGGTTVSIFFPYSTIENEGIQYAI